ncbi:hypothetical protein AB0C10_36570 [Microbispora amethystogenes]|uniref:hypothetical protein n=1 Tax=Microbispora amethystogenes TaxID=1427754 RepID=UPI0033DF8D94
MGIFKPSKVEQARMRELENAINYAATIQSEDGEDPAHLAAQARIRHAEQDLNPVLRRIARERTR